MSFTPRLSLVQWHLFVSHIVLCVPVVKIVPSITTESSRLFSVRSELSMKVVKEDKDNVFYCEVSYFVPGETRMTETKRINITVYCEYYISVGFHMSKDIYFQKYLRCHSFIH